jgi:hypothetical protein
MDRSETNLGLDWTQEVWQAAEKLASPQPAEREEALDYLFGGDYTRNSPLIAYLIATRISDPDLETRFHFIQAIGSVLSPDDNGVFAPDRVISYLQSVFANLNKGQILDLLAVAEQYISAEKSLVEIFKLSYYAGSTLSDIVNDQKIPVSLRQQAIYFSGEVGFLDSIPSLEGLIKRVDKRKHQDAGAPTQKRAHTEALLYPFAIAAVNKLTA